VRDRYRTDFEAPRRLPRLTAHDGLFIAPLGHLAQGAKIRALRALGGLFGDSSVQVKPKEQESFSLMNVELKTSNF
jgi:hypothetical protein